MVQKQEEKALIQAFFGQNGRRRKNNGGRKRACKQNNRDQNQNKSPHLPNIQTASKITKEGKKNAQEEVVTCQICGKKRGHSAAFCQNRYKYMDKKEVPQVLAAMNFNQQIDKQIYADSNATAHMVNDPGKLDTFFSYKGHDKNFVGNGQALKFHILEIFL